MDLLDSEADQATRDAVSAALTPMEEAALLKPVESANYTDFYASIHHATRVGRLFRPENPLLPNYKYVPIGYHGRASSIVVSGRRPPAAGQTKPGRTGGVPGFGPTRFLDYEVEVGMYIAKATRWASRPIARPENTSSAFRCSTTGPRATCSPGKISRWARSWPRALPPASRPGWCPWPRSRRFAFRPLRPPTIPIPLTICLTRRSVHRRHRPDRRSMASDPAMRAAGQPPHRLSQANLRDLYWTPAQLIAHHTSNGCNLLPGDLLATGTVSGREDESPAACSNSPLAASSPSCCPTAKAAPPSKTATR
jgi:fumarylacetoacetase